MCGAIMGTSWGQWGSHTRSRLLTLPLPLCCVAVWYSLGLQLNVVQPPISHDEPPLLQLRLTFAAVFSTPAPDVPLSLSSLWPHWDTIQACAGAQSSLLTRAASGQIQGSPTPLTTTQHWHTASAVLIPAATVPLGRSTSVAASLLLEAHVLGSGLSHGLLLLRLTQLHPQHVAASWPSQASTICTCGKDGAPPAGLCSGGLHQPCQYKRSDTVAEGNTSSGLEGGLVCVELTVPWTMRVWTHTLSLALDGKVGRAETFSRRLIQVCCKREAQA